MKDQVRRMAENDEPKCGNCRYWKTDNVNPDFERFTLRKCTFNDMGPRYPHQTYTLDLSLCSAWEPKE